MRVTIKTQRSESFSLLGFKPSTSQIWESCYCCINSLSGINTVCNSLWSLMTVMYFVQVKTMGKLLGTWITIMGGSHEKVTSWPRPAGNIYLKFLFWIAVQVMLLSPQSNTLSITSRIDINFL
jgi:hypothetical protein